MIRQFKYKLRCTLVDVHHFQTPKILGLEHVKNTNPRCTNTRREIGRQGFTRFDKMHTSLGQERERERSINLHKITRGLQLVLSRTHSENP